MVAVEEDNPMKNLIRLFIICLLSGVSFGQNISIKGIVQNAEGETLPGSSVMLIGAQDSILKGYSITNKEGAFNITGVKTGSYFLKASSFGYTPFEKEVNVDEGSSDLDVGTVTLQPKSLNTVVVQGEYIPLQIKGDTLEYDSRAFEVKEHDVVEDLLKQLPGVEVDENGTITVQGEEVDQVLVDGEKFFGEDATIATKNLPANSVSKVQVYDKKSDQSEFTGVDEGTEKTTINLQLKESHKKGTFGNISVAGGTQLPTNNTVRYESKANLFHFKKKWQFSVIGMSNNVNQTGFTYSDYNNFMGGAQTFIRHGGDGGSSGLNLTNGDPDDGFLTTHATGINLNYKPSDKTDLNTSFFFNSFDKLFNKTLDRETYFTDSTLFTSEVADQNSQSFNGRAEIKLEQKFDTTHLITFNFSGDIGQTTYMNDNTVENSDDESNLLSSFNTDLDQVDFNYSFESDLNYRKKFLKSGRYTGLELAYDRSNQDIETYLDYLNTLVSNGVPSTVVTNQQQFSLQTTDDLNGLWTWSEPVGKTQLMQFDLSFRRRGESRNKEVYDNQSDVLIINPYFSGDGAYYRNHANAIVRHKWFGKKIKTTLGGQYKFLYLAGQDLFTAPQEFHYVLPSAIFEWDPNKKSNMRLNYSSSINAPTLNQLQPIPDNTNPSQVVLGNTALIPEYTHRVSLRYRNFNQFNFSFFFASLTGTLTENNIIYSQQINPFYVTELTPENIGQERGINAFVMYGTSIHPIKTKFRIKTSGNISNGLINLNGMQDGYTTYSLSPGITFENIGKKVMDLRTGFSYNYSLNTYEQNSNLNNNFQNYNYYVNASFKIKDRWLINPIINHYFYPGFENNNQLILVDFTVACNFLESRKLQVFASAKDLLNQNTGLNQYYLQNFYEEEVTQTLGRYVMLGIKYSFQSLGKKQKSEE